MTPDDLLKARRGESIQIPVCLWFLARDRSNGRFRDRHGERLSIDARKFGTMVDRFHRELTDADITRIAGAYRPGADAGADADINVLGFSRAATTNEIRRNGHVLTPGRFVGAAALQYAGEPFNEKMRRLVATLREQPAEASARHRNQPAAS